MATLHLEIVTPEAKTFDDNVDMVVVPGTEGELGILPQHVPLMTTLAPGELRIVKDGKETILAVGEGFVEVTQDHVSVLTDMAIEESDIDEGKATEAIARAEAALREKALAGEEYVAVQSALLKSLAQLKVKRRRHS
ncbi:MAG: F0F1 ATP synthase subunit epsilon [Chthoniobacterales bacterium]